MAEFLLNFGSALIAFGPFVSLFALVIYQKAQLVIVVTSAAFCYLVGSMGAGLLWSLLDVISLSGSPLAAIVPGVFFPFVARCAFVSLYHRVEQVIQISLAQHDEDNQNTADNNNDARDNDWNQVTKLKLALNDASCGIAAGVGYGGMHALLLFGTLLASDVQNKTGVRYQDSCPMVPSLVVSALYAAFFFVLDMFWMLFTFFGMRRRLVFHRGDGELYDGAQVDRRLGAWFGNTRNGGNVALLFALGSHLVAALLTTADYWNYGCSVSIPALGVMVLVVAYIFWAGIGRIYLPKPAEDPHHES